MSMKRIIEVALAVMMVALCSIAVTAQEAVPNYSEIKAELDALAGALDKAAGTVLFTYLPGEGATFVMTMNSNDPDSIRSLFARVAQFFVPSATSVPDNERFTFAARYDLWDEWELILTMRKADASNPDAWKWYFSRGK